MTQTITLKVSIDCDACKRKVKKALEGIPGVETIDVDMKNERVVVVGSVDPKVIVKKLAKVGKKVEMPGKAAAAAGRGGDHGYHHNANDQGHDMAPNHFGVKGKGKNSASKSNGGRRKLGGSAGAIAGESDDDGSGHEILQGEHYAHFFSDENANSCSLM